MTQQIPLDASSVIGTDTGNGVIEVRPDVAYLRLTLVNVVFIGPAGAGDRGWVMIDTGLPDTAATIMAAAAHRFGILARPLAIIQTHGHFDHVGVLEELADHWDVPVYAHQLEHPYLDGSAAYPPPDPKIGGGLMSLASPLYPRGPVNVGSRLQALPADGSVSHMDGWRWVHTPGHSVGHVSLWRQADRMLLAADAVITTAQESAYAVLTAETELHGPPMYFTQDWPAARRSVEILAQLEPEYLLTGHGMAVHGPVVRAGLRELARRFDQLAHPPHPHYELHPARAEDGSAYASP
ncbi:MBL fold metallo-hydrolase [Lichenicola cladoniae]|uniref:MBL fold metallo-hydrolase n=1 Tax=Lichenicola cladoniae TaxID=1484109 RepID=A0A6M8HT13_9PROT|nr:MBL fold metallo-hydrolase [Lichenicola cladoniae]NPD67725.1 MBL fold metallo-hydrolase [Acetobacteraceae bacterium]QKE91654.1 MBL fold metallo-hydrolase [Lichenicola cladoniae]